MHVCMSTRGCQSDANQVGNPDRFTTHSNRDHDISELEGTPAISIIFVFCFIIVVLK